MNKDSLFGSFIWNKEKEAANILKHGVDFSTACLAFKDVERKMYIDSKHNEGEERFFCVGKAGEKVITVRFTYREGKVRIFGAGHWRKGKDYYEKENL